MVGGVVSAKAAGAIKPAAMHVMTKGFKEINLVIIYPFAAETEVLAWGESMSQCTYLDLLLIASFLGGSSVPKRTTSKRIFQRIALSFALYDAVRLISGIE